MSSTENQKAGVPTLHHLNEAQSQRIIWLLEELEIEYNLILHERTPKKHRAPPELINVQQLGKAPILVTADGRAIIESSAIVAYLLKTYDTAGKFAAEDWIRDETLTSFAGATLGVWNSLQLLFVLAAAHTPWPFNYLMRGVRNAMEKNIIMPEFKKSMVYLEGELGESDWFNGKQLGRADVMLSWPFDMIAQWGWIDFDKEYPRLGAWRKRVLERPAWKRGIEKGNGYDLTKIG